MIQILNKRAITHDNHCEDDYWIHSENGVIVGAVLDGCSTGINSHFASTLVKYSLENSKDYIRYTTCPAESAFDFLTQQVKKSMVAVAGYLGLTDMNLLSTIVFFHYDTYTKELVVKFFGDGVVYVNGERNEHSEDNAPQYLAYHMDDNYDDFEAYLLSRKTLNFNNVVEFKICSDGIDSLVNIKNMKVPSVAGKEYLLYGDDFKTQKTGLAKRFKLLTSHNNELPEGHSWWVIKDDLTVISYTNEIN